MRLVVVSFFSALARIQAGTLRLQPEPMALRRLLERVLEQLPPDQRAACSLEGGNPLGEADAPSLRYALLLLLRHVCDGAIVHVSIRLEATSDAQLWLSGPINAEVADPLVHIDQLLDSSDPGRGRQAADLLRLVLSRALIELHGGRWTVAGQSDAGPALCLTLPLADQDGSSA